MQHTISTTTDYPYCLFFCKNRVLSNRGHVLIYLLLVLGLFISYYAGRYSYYVILALFIIISLISLGLYIYGKNKQKSSQQNGEVTRLVEIFTMSTYALLMLYTIGNIIGLLVYPHVPSWAVYIVLVVLLILLILFCMSDVQLQKYK